MKETIYDQRKLKKRQMIRINMHAHYTKGEWLKLSGMVLLGSFKISYTILSS